MKKLLCISLSLIFLFVVQENSIAQNLSLNDSFGIGGVGVCGDEEHNDMPGELLVQPDGKYVMVGDSYERSTNQWYIVMCRFNTNGNLDSSFGTEGVVVKKNDFRAIGRGAALQADGKILVVGSENNSNGSSTITAAVFRFNSDGSDDTDFGVNGVQSLGFNGEFMDVEATDDGKIVLMGVNLASRTNQVFRLFSDGAQDTTFSTDGRATRGPSWAFQTGYDAEIANNGHIYTSTSGLFSSQLKLVITSTLSDGEPDTTFNSSGSVVTPIVIVNNLPVEIEVDDAGMVYVAATVRNQSNSRNAMVVSRYNPDGSLDTGFGSNGETRVGFENENLSLRGLKLSADGGFYLLGAYSTGFGIGSVHKFTSDGNLDPNFQGDGFFAADFNSNTGTHWAQDLVEDSDGSIYVSGYDFASRAGDLVIVKFTPMVNTSIEVPFDQTNLEIYPNPSSGALFIRGDVHEGFDRLEIFDALGRLVSSEEIGNQEVNRISTKDLPKGNYFARISGGDRHSTKKIIVL